MRLRRNSYAWSDVRKLDNSIAHKVLVWLGWRRSPSLAARAAFSGACATMAEQFRHHPERAEAARKAFHDGLVDDPRRST